MRQLAVWASHQCFGQTCEDGSARLGGGAYPGGSTSGQAGWHVGLTFPSLSDLADQLDPTATRSGARTQVPGSYCGSLWGSCGAIQRGEVKRLAIHCHGAPGQLFVNGGGASDCQSSGGALTASSACGSDQPFLHRIGLATARQGGLIMFMSCNAGQGPAGDELLRVLSRIWPDRRVVCFVTQGYYYAGRMMPTGGVCHFPGARDTEYEANLGTERLDSRWSDLTLMPWWHGRSPTAKIALNGAVVWRGSHVRVTEGSAPAAPLAPVPEPVAPGARHRRARLHGVR